MIEKEIDILTAVDERKGELLQILGDLILFPTVSPPARNTTEAQRYIEQFLKDEKFETVSWDVYPNDPNVV